MQIQGNGPYIRSVPAETAAHPLRNHPQYDGRMCRLPRVRGVFRY